MNPTIPHVEERGLDIGEQISLFSEFFNTYLLKEIFAINNSDRESLFLDFSALSQFNVQLSEQFLATPEDAFKAAELAITKLDVTKKIRLRLFNLPKSLIVPIKDIRSKHIGKLISVRGVIRQKSGVKPVVLSARFECPSCGNIISLIQDEQSFQQPQRCSCGRKGKFKLIDKDLIDAQRIVIEESHESLDSGAQPKRLPIFLRYDLASPWTDHRTNPGTRVLTNGVVTEKPLPSKTGGQSTTSELVLEGNYIEPLEEDFSDIKIAAEEEMEIRTLAAQPAIYSLLRESIAPSIYGHELIKDALVLQLFGGIRKVRDDGIVTRGDTHILLIGDPGTGKCISGDTKVILGDGTIISFAELAAHEMESTAEWFPSQTPLLSFDLDCKVSSRPSLRLWKRPCQEKMFLLRTASGRELKATEQHPFFTTYGGFVYGEELAHLKKGDFIALPRALPIQGSLQLLPGEIRRAHAHYKQTLTLPTVLDASLAKFFAYIIAEGYVAYTLSSGIVSFNNNDVNLISDFRTIVERYFKIPVHERHKKQSRGNTIEVYTSSRELLYFLEAVEPKLIASSGSKVIPKVIHRSPNTIIAPFLATLFECDGTVRLNPLEVSYTSKSRALVDEIQILLLRFGIQSRIASRWKRATNTKNKTLRQYYTLTIYGHSARLFAQNVGFISERKRAILETACARRIQSNTNVDVIPHVSRILKVLRLQHGFTQSNFPIPRTTYQHYERGDRLPSRDHLAILSEFYQSHSPTNVFVQALHKMAHSDIFWDKIVDIQEIPSEEYVYDFEVAETHNFIANGVMIHNSQLIKRLSTVAPKARFVSGKGVSGAGLTATVMRDEFTGSWVLEAGALVLANKGYLMIDEMDKMNKEDRDAMHEGLEQQSISVSKANVQATLRCETTVLAAANPKFGRFDPYLTIAEQIDMPASLISRFDLIFPVKDLPDRQKDIQMSEFILRLHQRAASGLSQTQPPVSTAILRKYVAFARQNVTPVLTDAALQEIQQEYVELRNAGGAESSRAVSITSRQLEGIIRLAEAAARIRLSQEVSIEDARRAISLVVHTLQEIATDKETGRIDIDKITSGITASSRSKIVMVKEIIVGLEEKIGKVIPIDDIIKEAEQRGITADKVEEALERLKRSGDIFEPRVNFVSRL